MHRRLFSSLAIACLLTLGLAGTIHAQQTGPTGPTGTVVTNPDAADEFDAQLEVMLRSKDQGLHVHHSWNKDGKVIGTQYTVRLSIDGMVRKIVVGYFPGKYFFVFEALTNELPKEQEETIRQRIKASGSAMADQVHYELSGQRYVAVYLETELALSTTATDFPEKFESFVRSVTPLVASVKDLR
jgi:hypothetical protein